MTVWIAVKCPYCQSTNVVKNGKSKQGKQRCRCRNTECLRSSFILDYTNHGYQPEVKQKIGAMVTNGSRVRDTARVFKINASTVMSELKKTALIEQVNYKWLQEKSNQDLKVVLVKAEVDEMTERGAPSHGAYPIEVLENYVGKKQYQRWLWHAIDHKTGTILAFVLGRRQDRVFLQLKKLLKPFGITKFYTDNLKTYERHLAQEERTVSKYNLSSG